MSSKNHYYKKRGRGGRRKKHNNRNKHKKHNTCPHKLFVGGLPPLLRNHELVEYFDRFGELQEAQIMFDKDTKKSRGFAFVTYRDPEVAYYVLEQDHYIQGKLIDCKIAFSKSKARNKILDEKERKIFVGGLSHDTNDFQLRAYFDQFGYVEIANVIKDPITGKSRGFGFVVFRNKGSIYEVLNHRDKHFLNKKWIDCKPALLREEIKRPRRDDDQVKSSKGSSSNDRYEVKQHHPPQHHQQEHQQYHHQDHQQQERIPEIQLPEHHQTPQEHHLPLEHHQLPQEHHQKHQLPMKLDKNSSNCSQQKQSEEKHSHSKKNTSSSHGISLPGPVSHHPQELYAKPQFPDISSTHTFSPMNFRPPKKPDYQQDPRSVGPSPMNFPNRHLHRMLHKHFWGNKRDIMTPTTASHHSPHHRGYYMGESPAIHSHSKFVENRMRQTQTPTSYGSGFYRNGLVGSMKSPFLRSGQENFRQAPRQPPRERPKGFSQYFNTRITEDNDEE